MIELRSDGETTENLGMPIAPWWQVVTVLFYLGVAVQALVVVSNLRSVLRGSAIPRHAPADPGPSASDA